MVQGRSAGRLVPSIVEIPFSVEVTSDWIYYREWSIVGIGVLVVVIILLVLWWIANGPPAWLSRRKRSGTNDDNSNNDDDDLESFADGAQESPKTTTPGPDPPQSPDPPESGRQDVPPDRDDDDLDRFGSL
jgi:hypothetical protein